MTEDKDIQSIRTKLQGYSAEPPTFDALFRDEVLGEAGLRGVCQSKLLNHTAEAPSYEALMAPVIPLPRKRHVSYTLWVTGFAVAACLGLLFFLPLPIEQPQQNMGSVVEDIPTKHISNKPVSIKEQETPFLTEALTAPVSINELEVPATPAMDEGTTDSSGDSTAEEQLVKLKQTELSLLESEPAISIDDAYARARMAAKKRERGKMQAGMNVNGSNRLLSFVNTNRGSDPLLSTSNEYNKGITVLDGSQGISLRSATISRNEWKAPDNILSSSLNNYEATYSLPVNVGFSLSIPLSGLVEIQTGLYYTYMYSKTEGMTGTSSFTLRRELHYLGIPVKLAFNIYQQKGFRIYMAVGGALEKGLSGNQQSTVVAQNGDESTWEGSQPVYGVQPSTNGLAGISYECRSGISMFVEPGASYCYDTDQPTSIRTEEPFSFNLGLGLRYRLK